MKRTKMNIAGLSLVLALGACGRSASDPVTSQDTAAGVETPEIASTAPSHSEWAGKWTGPEGLYVQITPTDAGAYNLEMQSDLDTKGTYPGQDAEGGIKFARGGESLLLHSATGDETGLTDLAGKKNCLMVKSGEGYCKDS